ncbi:denticleless protein homolog [Diadema antillarum]|uniref:denticleless protein homolog n=1 Tax=Diadema antillarum TaxID=105358 RepID=UPI003A8849DF
MFPSVFLPGVTHGSPVTSSYTWRWKSQQSRRIRSSLENCLGRLECRKENEYLFSSPEFVEGIPPFACEFAVQTGIDHLLAAADEDGHVVIYDTYRTGQEAQVKIWSAHNNAIFDTAWSPTDPRLVTASGDQTAALWDVKTSTKVASFQQHKCSLKSVSFRPWDGHIFATGARDGNIMIWDDRRNKGGTNQHKPVLVIKSAHADENKVKSQPRRRGKLAPNLPAIDSSQSVSVVLFQKEDTLLSAGAADGIVKVWDLRKMKSSGTSNLSPLHQFPYSGSRKRKRGFSSLALSSSRTRLFASCTDSVIYEYDLGGALCSIPLSQYSGHMNSTFFVRAALSPNDLFLLSGSSDNHAYIWKIGEPECPPLTLVGHEAEVTAVAWCQRDFTKVVTCSDDNTLRMWKLRGRESPIDDQLNEIIGRARRCEREPDIAGQDAVVKSQPGQTAQSDLSSKNRSTPTKEIPQSPIQSPLPCSTKKRKFSLRDWATTSPGPSRPTSSQSSKSSPKRQKQENAEDNTAVVPIATGQGHVKELATNKRKVSEYMKGDSTDNASLSSKKLKVVNGGCTPKSKTTPVQIKLSDKLVHQISEVTQNRGKSNPKSSSVLSMSSPKVSKSDNHRREVDQENVNHRKPRKESGREKVTTPNLPHQRSPLKDDIPMNEATSHALNSVKKNIASAFSDSPKSVLQCEKRKGDGEKCRTLKDSFGEKKVGRLLQTKRRNSSGTIDSYFQPLPKRHKSET